MMQLDIQATPFSLTPALEQAVRDHAEQHLRRFSSDIGALNVRLYDTNGTRGGPDMACRIYSDLGRARPLIVEVVHEDLYVSIAQAFSKAERGVGARLKRRTGQVGRRQRQALRDVLVPAPDLV